MVVADRLPVLDGWTNQMVLDRRLELHNLIWDNRKVAADDFDLWGGLVVELVHSGLADVSPNPLGDRVLGDNLASNALVVVAVGVLDGSEPYGVVN